MILRVPTDDEITTAVANLKVDALYDLLVLEEKNLANTKSQHPSTIRIQSQSLSASRYQLKTTVQPFVDTLLQTSGELPKIRRMPLKDRKGILELLQQRDRLLKKEFLTYEEKEECESIADMKRVLERALGEYDPKYNVILPQQKYDSNISSIFKTSPLTNPILAHELAHARQHQNHLQIQTNRSFAEGHANGVERKFLDIQPSAYDQDLLLGRLEIANGILLFKDIYYDKGMFSNKMEAANHRMKIRNIPKYSLGYAAFRLAETQYSPQIYADTLREPMLLLDVLRDA